MEVIEVCILAYRFAISTPNPPRHSREAAGLLGDCFEPDSITCLIAVVGGDQGHIISSPHDRLAFLLKNPYIEGRMNRRQMDNPSYFFSSNIFSRHCPGQLGQRLE